MRLCHLSQRRVSVLGIGRPSRPIVSACSCPTELISSYLDKIMAPIVKSLPSYIKNARNVNLCTVVNLHLLR